jgi:hypothetical protein
MEMWVTIAIFLLCAGALCFPILTALAVALVFYAVGWTIAAIITAVTGIVSGIGLLFYTRKVLR